MQLAHCLEKTWNRLFWLLHEESDFQDYLRINYLRIVYVLFKNKLGHEYRKFQGSMFSEFCLWQRHEEEDAAHVFELKIVLCGYLWLTDGDIQ